MARRSTKAGPARSRRRPDPAFRKQPGQVIMPLEVSNITFGTGTVDVEVQALNPTTGGPWNGADAYKTERPSNGYIIDSTGTKNKMTIASVDADGYTVFNQVTEVAAGGAIVILPGLDPAVRTQEGGFIGTLAQAGTVT